MRDIYNSNQINICKRYQMFENLRNLQFKLEWSDAYELYLIYKMKEK